MSRGRLRLRATETERARFPNRGGILTACGGDRTVFLSFLTDKGTLAILETLFQKATVHRGGRI